jgi:taurine dioxygenase
MNIPDSAQTRCETHRHNQVDGFEAIDLSWQTGCEIRGLDLRCPERLADETIQALAGLVAERGLLLFRDQMIDHDQHIAFTKRFGTLAQTGMIDRYAPPGYPDIYRVTNMKIDGVRSEVWDAARLWHSDQSFMPEPAMGSLLRCERTPDIGGDTIWANMYAAFERLSDGLQATLAGLRVRHTLRTMKMERRAPERSRKAYDPGETMLNGSVHPIVRIHPVTGRKALYLSEHFVECIEGWTIEESEPLLRHLFAFSTQHALTYRHRWRPGDLIFWDNRCTLHYAPEDYDVSALDAPGNQRLMYRTTLAGTVPF